MSLFLLKSQWTLARQVESTPASLARAPPATLRASIAAVGLWASFSKWKTETSAPSKVWMEPQNLPGP